MTREKGKRRADLHVSIFAFQFVKSYIALPLPKSSMNRPKVKKDSNDKYLGSVLF